MIRIKLKQPKSLKETQVESWVYHVTFLGRLESIQEYGLVPGGSSNFGGGYDAHSSGKIFLSSPEGVFFWHSKFEDLANNNSDWDSHSSFEWYPVILRIDSDYLDELDDDEIGSRDASSDAWSVSETIESEYLEIFTNRGWRPLDRVDPESLKNFVISQSNFESEDSEFDEDDEESWRDEDEGPPGYYEPNFDVLFPEELKK